MKTNRNIVFTLAVCLFSACPGSVLGADQPASRGRFGPQVVSPEVLADRTVTFRILAPNASDVRVSGNDMPEIGQGVEMTKGDEGVWSVTLGPVGPGYYRYNFNVDGVAVIDPRNPATSESNANTWSLVGVPGLDYMDTQNVPHGAVAEVTYYSEPLKRIRRMHVYTPPGYESGEGVFPVFFLLHGAMDCDESWTSVGRAGFILDNLIAQGKAKPMVVVMTAGHTGPFRMGGARPTVDEFQEDFNKVVVPYIEEHYRVLTDRAHRAIAGLSMGGAQTITAAMTHFGNYAYIGVFSSGVFGITGGFGGNNQGPSFEEQHQGVLDDPKLKEGLKLFWFGTGKDDFLVETSRATVEMFRKHKFDVEYMEGEGGHTWIVWREYLRDFAPRLFQ